MDVAKENSIKLAGREENEEVIPSRLGVGVGVGLQSCCSLNQEWRFKKKKRQHFLQAGPLVKTVPGEYKPTLKRKRKRLLLVSFLKTQNVGSLASR